MEPLGKKQITEPLGTKMNHANQTSPDQTRPNGSKWVHMGPNWSKWVQVGPNWSISLEIGGNGSKLAQMGPNRSKWVQMDLNLSKEVKKGDKKLQIAPKKFQGAPNSSK